jgi:glycosyltransferase involved in cell wall biosynthesis
MEVVWLKPKNANPLSLGIPDEKQIQAAADRIPQIIAATTFGVAICKMNAGDSLLASMPTKIAEYLSCGIPVVVNGGLGDFDVLIKKYRAGVVIEEDSEEAIRSASIELWGVLNDAETPQRCRELVINHLTLEAGVDSYFKIYEKLIGRQFFS